MKLEYAGPKEIISPFGVTFKSGKEDKFVYIQPALQIFKALHHHYDKGIVYNQDVQSFKYEEELLLKELLEYDKSLYLKAEEDVQSYEQELDLEIETIFENKTLNEQELSALKNNLILMKAYRKQRLFNRLIYNELIEMIVDEIFLNKIRQINTPFNERFWHILQTVQGELSNHERRSIGSNLSTSNNSEQITVILDINAIL